MFDTEYNNNNKIIEINNLYKAIYLILSIAIIMLILLVTYVIFTIIGLIQISLNEQINICEQSHLWIYSLLSLIILLINCINKISENHINTNTNNKKKVIIYIFIQLFLSTLMILWGIYEFFGNICIDDLKSTILYKTSFLYWIVENIKFIILFLLFINYLHTYTIIPN